MKKLILVGALCAIAIATAASAAEKKTIQVSPNEANAISLGIMALDGHHHTVKDARGQDADVQEPYHMAPGLSVTLGHDLGVLRAFLNEAQNAIKGRPDDAVAISNTRFPLDVLTFSMSDLQANQNDYPASAMANIEPLLSDYVAPVIPSFDSKPKP